MCKTPVSVLISKNYAVCGTSKKANMEMLAQESPQLFDHTAHQTKHSRLEGQRTNLNTGLCPEMGNRRTADIGNQGQSRLCGAGD